MDFLVDKLIGYPTKKRKTQKRRRDNGEAEAEKASVVVSVRCHLPWWASLKRSQGCPP